MDVGRRLISKAHGGIVAASVLALAAGGIVGKGAAPATRPSTRPAAATLAATAASTAPAVLPYKDTSLPFEKRVADLISRMTLQEKAEQLEQVVARNARLGIPAMNWWTE